VLLHKSDTKVFIILMRGILRLLLFAGLKLCHEVLGCCTGFGWPAAVLLCGTVKGFVWR
jgi:hypothetical protein